MFHKRIIISAGGTGGHLFPAQALAQQLINQPQPIDVLFVAAGLGFNRFFDRSSFRFEEISSSPLISRNPLKCLKGAYQLMRGIKQSCLIFKNYRPDAVVAFGSYYTIPVVLAAKVLKVPIILHEANSIPGRANHWLAPLATYVATHFPLTSTYFKCPTIEVGLPLRQGYQLNFIKRESAIEYYGLNPEKKTLLIFGGSQGAKAINEVIKKCLYAFRKHSLQIIHLTGNEEKVDELKESYQKHEVLACVKAFENNMNIAWSAADAFLGRSGASTIAESIEFEVPGILIPYPYATDGHQEKNADFLVDTVKSAVKVLEPALTQERLVASLDDLFQKGRVEDYKTSIKKYKLRPHQQTLCELVLQI